MSDPRVNPGGDLNEHEEENCFVHLVGLKGHTEAVKLLLLADPRVDPFARENFAHIAANDNGHTKARSYAFSIQKNTRINILIFSFQLR
jgi:hypothetical protein